MKLSFQIACPLDDCDERAFALWYPTRGDYARVSGVVVTFPSVASAYLYIGTGNLKSTADVVEVSSLISYSPAHPSIAARTFEERQRYMPSRRDTKRARAQSLKRHYEWLSEALAARDVIEAERRNEADAPDIRY